MAEFYRELVGGDITHADEDWLNLSDGDTVLLRFQPASDYQPPEWPNPHTPSIGEAPHHVIPEHRVLTSLPPAGGAFAGRKAEGATRR